MNEKQFYDKIYLKNKYYAGGGEHASYKFKEVIKEINKISSGFDNVLDIGCSTGLFLHNYVRAKNKYGLDISATVVDRARKNGIIADVINLNNEILPFKENLFDLVFCMDILDHLFSPLDVLIKIRKIIRPNGYIIITLPNDLENIFKKLKILAGNAPMLRYKNNGHIRFFNKRTIFKIIREAGYKVVLIRGYGKIPCNRAFPDLLSYGYIAIAKKIK